MIKRLNKLIKEASNERDKEYRDIARKIFNELIEKLNNNEASWLPSSVKRYDKESHQIVGEEKEGLFIAFYFMDGKKEKTILSFHLVFTDQFYSSFGSFDKSQKNIMIALGENIISDIKHGYSPSDKYIKNLRNKAIFLLKSSKTKNIVIHEIIHFLDYLRFKDKTSFYVLANHYEDLIGYLSHPIESNAYQQAFFAGLEDYIDKHGWYDYDLNDFNEFKMYLDYIRHHIIDKENRYTCSPGVMDKKFKKRLYTFWKGKFRK